MLKVASYDIVFQEIPGEVTLALNLSGCPCHCKGCHSPHLWEDTGEELDEELLLDLLNRYGSQITCVVFMGGDQAPDEVVHWAEYVKHLSSEPSAAETFSLRSGLKTAWYSGRSAVPPSIEGKVGGTYDFLKLGPYIESLGGLKSPTTNQRLYKRSGDSWQDITSTFHRSRFS